MEENKKNNICKLEMHAGYIVEDALFEGLYDAWTEGKTLPDAIVLSKTDYRQLYKELADRRMVIRMGKISALMFSGPGWDMPVFPSDEMAQAWLDFKTSPQPSRTEMKAGKLVG